MKVSHYSGIERNDMQTGQIHLQNKLLTAFIPVPVYSCQLYIAHMFAHTSKNNECHLVGQSGCSIAALHNLPLNGLNELQIVFVNFHSRHFHSNIGIKTKRLKVSLLSYNICQSL